MNTTPHNPHVCTCSERIGSLANCPAHGLSAEPIQSPTLTLGKAASNYAWSNFPTGRRVDAINTFLAGAKFAGSKVEELKKACDNIERYAASLREQVGALRTQAVNMDAAYGLTANQCHATQAQLTAATARAEAAERERDEACRQLAEADELQEESDNAMRDCCLAVGFDPSDGEGTSPKEVADAVASEIVSLREQLIETAAAMEKMRAVLRAINQWAESSTGPTRAGAVFARPIMEAIQPTLEIPISSALREHDLALVERAWKEGRASFPGATGDTLHEVWLSSTIRAELNSGEGK